MKKLISTMLAFVMVISLTTIPVFADQQLNGDKAATLKDLGLYQGQDPNDATVGLESALTTQDSLIFLAKLFGYNDDAAKLSADDLSTALAKFDDAASISDYAKNVVAYSATNGILSGSTKDGKFFVGAKDTVTAARFATFILRQMGYTVADYKASVAELAQTQGSKVDATVTGDLTRDTAVGVMYGSLTAEKASGKTVISDIVGDNADLKAKAEKLGLIPTPVITTDVVVESVEALNCKQIKVVFNQKMDKYMAESEDFYEVYDKGSKKVEIGDSSASLGNDDKTVTITLNKNVADKLTNSSEAKVVVKKDIKSANGLKLAEDAICDEVKVEDGLIPTVTKVEATGVSNIRITFSEPVYDKGKDNIISKYNFKVVSGTYEYYVSNATLDHNVINLEIGTKLVEGPVTVTVNNAGSDKDDAIVDYAHYAVFKSSTTFDYVKDTSVSVVTVKSARGDKVVLKFSKPVKGSNISLYHSKKNDESKKAKEDTATRYVDEITFTFDTPLPSGTVTLYLVNSENEKEKLTDGFGIKVPDQTLICDVEEVELPEVPAEPKRGSHIPFKSSADTKAYNTLVSSLPANNDNYTYTIPSWGLYADAIGVCKLTLTANDDQEVVDAEVIKIKAASNLLKLTAEVNTSDYDTIVSSLPQNNYDTYLLPSWELFKDAIGECDLTLTAKDGQEALDAEVIKIQEALNLLELTPKVNTSDYDTIVRSLPENNDNYTYTILSWAFYTDAIGVCNLTLTAQDGQEALDAEVIKIQEALYLLVLTSDINTSDYDTIVSSLPMNNNDDIYTMQSWGFYADAIGVCDLNLTAIDGQEALDAEVIKIQEALYLLVLTAEVNTSDYDAIVSSLPENNDNYTYTRPSWGFYADAIGVCDLNLTAIDGQEAIDAELNKIQEALNLLELRAEVNTSEYDTIVSSLPHRNDNYTYTRPSWGFYADAIGVCDLNLTAIDGQEALDAEVIKIREALDLLELRAEVNTLDYDTLVSLLPENNDSDIYTSPSWGLYADAIGECDLTLTAIDGQEALDEEIIRIQKALDLLRLATETN